MRFVRALIVIFLSVSCVERSYLSSNVKGHFEDYSSERLEKYSGTLSFVPEYAPGQSVIVSEKLFQLVSLEMMTSILDAGVPRLYVVTDLRTAETSEVVRKELLRKRVDGIIRFRGAVSSEDMLALDRIFASVIPILQESPLYSDSSQQLGTSVWARDWAPLATQSHAGGTVAMDLNYYKNRQIDDSSARAFMRYFSAKHNENLTFSAPKDRVSFPVYNEGGNFMNSPEWCFMTDRVVEANSNESGQFFDTERVAQSQGKVTPDVVYNRDQLIALYNRFGCKRTEIFPRMPHERTGHIDMWAKLVSDKTVLVADLRDESIEAARTPAADGMRLKGRTVEQDIAEMKEIQKFLRERQSWFREHGFEVITLPMPTIVASIMGNITRSYTNSLMLNKTLITPRYRRSTASFRNTDYPDSTLLLQYETEVETKLQKAGFQVKFIETDNLIFSGGSVHCTTMQVPW